MSGQPGDIESDALCVLFNSQRLLWFGCALPYFRSYEAVSAIQVAEHPPPEYYVSYELLKYGLMEKADEDSEPLFDLSISRLKLVASTPYPR